MLIRPGLREAAADDLGDSEHVDLNRAGRGVRSGDDDVAGGAEQPGDHAGERPVARGVERPEVIGAREIGRA